MDTFASVDGSMTRYRKQFVRGSQDLDLFCAECLRRVSLARDLLGTVGNVVDPHNQDIVCAGYGTDAWSHINRDSRSLSHALGMGKYPHTPSFVGADINFTDTSGSLLVISVGMPMNYESVAWTFDLAQQKRGNNTARVVFIGFVTTSDIRTATSIACDKQWLPSGITEVGTGMTCNNAYASEGKAMVVSCPPNSRVNALSLIMLTFSIDILLYYFDF